MAQHSSEAFVLRKTQFGESDLVLTLFTREHGKATVMARGARASRRRFGFAGLEPFTIFQAQWQSDPRRELALLQSVSRPLVYPGLLADLDALSAGWRILELVQSFKQAGQAEPPLFELVLQAFRRLDQGYDPAHRLWFEACLLVLEGFGDERLVEIATRFDGKKAEGDWRNVEAALDRRIMTHLGHALKTSGYDQKLGARA